MASMRRYTLSVEDSSFFRRKKAPQDKYMVGEEMGDHKQIWRHNIVFAICLCLASKHHQKTGASVHYQHFKSLFKGACVQKRPQKWYKEVNVGQCRRWMAVFSNRLLPAEKGYWFSGWSFQTHSLFSSLFGELMKVNQ